jgi:hypothetical protein
MLLGVDKIGCDENVPHKEELERVEDEKRIRPMIYFIYTKKKLGNEL